VRIRLRILFAALDEQMNNTARRREKMEELFMDYPSFTPEMRRPTRF
jgi:hypothetical protein